MGTILITGASGGIGREVVKLFHQRGWNVVATMRSPDKAGDLAELPNVLVTKLDVTDADSIDTAVRAGIERFGAIDVLVNNAGYGVYAPLRRSRLRPFASSSKSTCSATSTPSRGFFPTSGGAARD